MKLPHFIYEPFISYMSQNSATWADKLYKRLQKKYMKQAGYRIVAHDVIVEIKNDKMLHRSGDFFLNALKVLRQVLNAVGEDFESVCEYYGYKEGNSMMELHQKIFYPKQNTNGQTTCNPPPATGHID
jgi:hypothetical protein